MPYGFHYVVNEIKYRAKLFVNICVKCDQHSGSSVVYLAVWVIRDKFNLFSDNNINCRSAISHQHNGDCFRWAFPSLFEVHLGLKRFSMFLVLYCG